MAYNFMNRVPAVGGAPTPPIMPRLAQGGGMLGGAPPLPQNGGGGDMGALGMLGGLGSAGSSLMSNYMMMRMLQGNGQTPPGQTPPFATPGPGVAPNGMPVPAMKPTPPVAPMAGAMPGGYTPAPIGPSAASPNGIPNWLANLAGNESDLGLLNGFYFGGPLG